ncbi:MAG: hypothetical protein ACHQEM_03730 [Chitinophagales bacterium]
MKSLILHSGILLCMAGPFYSAAQPGWKLSTRSTFANSEFYEDSIRGKDHSNARSQQLTVPVIPARKTDQNLAQYFGSFDPLGEDDVYLITLCGDLPDDHDPDRIHVKDEPGHTFLILEKRNRNTSSPPIIKVFGFYPHRPASCLIFRNVCGEIMDNSGREYDVSLSTEISAKDFALILQKSQELSRRKYNLNKYNCYDYAVAIFNSLPGIEKLPLTHVKFPSIFGSGGSPCGLFRDLEKLKNEGSVWASHIHFGIFYAPSSNPD